MIIALSILGWVACGFAAVYIAGIVDRKLHPDTAPIGFLFIIGPLGLVFSIAMFVINSPSFLSKIYRKGLGK